MYIFSIFLFNFVQIIEFCFLFRWKNANKYDDDWEKEEEAEDGMKTRKNDFFKILQMSVSDCFSRYFVINWNLFVIIDHFYVILNENIFKTIINV